MTDQLTAPGHADVGGLIVLDDAHLLDQLGWLQRDVRTHLLHGQRHVEVDVSGLGTMSSTIVAGLLLAKRSCRARGATFAVVGAAAPVGSVLHVAGLVGEGAAR